jgi:hypothetical protein
MDADDGSFGSFVPSQASYNAQWLANLSADLLATRVREEAVGQSGETAAVMRAAADRLESLYFAAPEYVGDRFGLGMLAGYATCTAVVIVAVWMMTHWGKV